MTADSPEARFAAAGAIVEHWPARRAPDPAPSPIGPHYPAPAGTAAEARRALADLIGRFIHEAADYHATRREIQARAEAGDPVTMPPPPALAVPVGVGIGKTHAARVAIATALRDRTLARPIVYAVPTHQLGREQVDAFAALGVTAALWRGRSDGDGDPERATCHDMAAVRDAMAAGADPETAICGKPGSETCPHRDTCAFQLQKPVVAAADVVILPHASLFYRRPKAIAKPSLIVIDEGFTSEGLRSASVALDVIEDQASAMMPDGDMSASNDLATARAMLSRAMRATEPGTHVTLTALRAEGLTADEAREARKLEWRRKADPGMSPGMATEDRRAAVAAAAGNAAIPALAAVWRLVADALDGDHDAAGLTVDWATGRDGGSYLAARARWRADLPDSWSDGTPILHMDATMRRELVALYLPRARFGDPVDAVTPNVQVRQVLGAPVSARRLTPREGAPDRDHKAARHSLRDLLAYTRLRAMMLRRPAVAGPDVLVIGQRRAVEALREAGLPSNVDAAHFNALAGLDRWRDVAGMIVMGRTLPAPGTVEGMAAALTNRPPEARPDGWWYDREARGIRMSDGTAHAIQAEMHPDPMCEAIRWSVCEAELVQAIGRGRGVNRDADTPLSVDLLTDVVLPLVANEVTDWAAVRPTREAAMIAQGVYLDNAADRARAFPDLWPTADAAKKDAQRCGTNCYYISSLIAKCPPPPSVRYRVAGPGRRIESAAFDPDTIPDPESWLTERLGPLALYEPETTTASVVHADIPFPTEAAPVTVDRAPWAPAVIQTAPLASPAAECLEPDEALDALDGDMDAAHDIWDTCNALLDAATSLFRGPTEAWA
ncbi:hypothetical protein [uncultured Rhodospira sp.]|uniref:hypothetical protein n=1 Tax=uncultured Rhodospira sp. TaxID=1936189 RepID=UPI00261C4BA6|nr:hypothetical protein [uncultured Rhodospira sp.]